MGGSDLDEPGRGFISDIACCAASRSAWRRRDEGANRGDAWELSETVPATVRELSIVAATRGVDGRRHSVREFRVQRSRISSELYTHRQRFGGQTRASDSGGVEERERFEVLAWSKLRRILRS